MTANPVWGLVAAAGAGCRIGGTQPKQYHLIAGSTVLAWSLRAMLAVPDIRGVMLALASGDTHADDVAEASDSRVWRCRGGAERADTIRAALQALLARGAAPADRVLVHDAARPAVSAEDIATLLTEAGADPDGGLLAVPVRDTLKRGSADARVVATVPRDDLWQAMTPQLFPLGRLLHALDSAAAAGAKITDEAQAMEHMGAQPRLVPCRATNIKYTWPADDAWLESILTSNHGGR